MSTHNLSSNVVAVQEPCVKPTDDVMANIKESAQGRRVCKPSHAKIARVDRRRRVDHRVRSQRGTLAVGSPALHRRFLDEGVPETEVRRVAEELRHCLDLDHGALDGGPSCIAVSPWAADILARYGDKTGALFLATRGRGERV